MTDPAHEPKDSLPDDGPGLRGAVTPLRLVVWILGGGFAIYLIVTGVVGILTKAR